MSEIYVNVASTAADAAVAKGVATPRRVGRTVNNPPKRRSIIALARVETAPVEEAPKGE